MTGISRDKAQQIVDYYDKRGFGPGGEGVTSYCYAKRVLARQVRTPVFYSL